MNKVLKNLVCLLFIFVLGMTLTSCIVFIPIEEEPEVPETSIKDDFDCITIAEAIELALAAGETGTADKYYVYGTIKEVSNSVYGEMTITDGTDELYIYGVYSSDGNTRYDAMTDKVIYTGSIDSYFNYKLGALEYRSVRFENEVLDIPNFQGNAAVNYTDAETPWTRIIEHKWFEFGKDENGNDIPATVISKEYSSEWKVGDEPYYPVNDEKNGDLYTKYRELADKESKVIFGGRLGEYKYYDMDAVIASALEMANNVKGL